MRLIGRLILAAILFVLTGLLMAVGAASPDFLFSFYESFSKTALASIASVTSGIPFCVWEAAALILVLTLLYTLVQALRRARILSWLAGVLVTAGVLVFAFTALWGLNHYEKSVGERLSLSVRQYSVSELRAATEFYAAQADMLSAAVSRDASGIVKMESFETLAEKADDGYRKLSDEPLFAGECPKVKKLTAWPLYSRMGTTGIFVCFTAEPSVNPDTAAVWLPVTMCHEIAHSKLIAAEDAANFISYLTCMSNDDPQFQYSGAVAAYVYCHNALAKEDSAAASEVWNALDARVRADIEDANSHYQQYEGKIQDAAQKANDAYLKVFSEKSGVKSYGEVADYLIAWYLQINT